MVTQPTMLARYVVYLRALRKPDRDSILDPSGSVPQRRQCLINCVCWRTDIPVRERFNGAQDVVHSLSQLC